MLFCSREFLRVLRVKDETDAVNDIANVLNQPAHPSAFAHVGLAPLQRMMNFVRDDFRAEVKFESLSDSPVALCVRVRTHDSVECSLVRGMSTRRVVLQ